MPRATMLRAVLILFSATPLDGQNTALVGGTVFTAAGDRIEQGTVLLQGGTITAVGADIEIPVGTERIDVSGSWVTPGLVNAWTQLGLVEIAAVNGTVDGTQAVSVSPSFNPFEGINPASQLIPITRAAGVTTTLAMPTGGIVAGQGVAFDLAGTTVESMVIDRSAALVVSLGASTTDSAGGSRASVMSVLRRLFDDARLYDGNRPEHERGMLRALVAPAPELEAVLPVLGREQPLVASANRAADIDNAMRLAEDYGLRLVVAGAVDAWKVTERLARSGTYVVVNPLANIPSYDGLFATYENAMRLHRGEVRLIIATFDSHNARNLRQAAGKAIAHGLPWDAALRAVTAVPSEAFGLEDRGTLEAGKVANIVVWDGDPFELGTAPRHVFIRGREVDLNHRQAELLRRYRQLPPRD